MRDRENRAFPNPAIPGSIMRKLLRTLVLASAIGLGAPLAAYAAPLTEARELADRLASKPLRIVDIRDGKDTTGKTPYELGHLPGAVHAPYSQWRGPADNPGKAPDAAALTQLLQRLGIDRDTETIVVYEGKDSTDFGAAARVYWTLKSAGVANISILNGGMKAWREAGKPLSTEPVAVAPSKYVVQLDTRQLATRADVERTLAGGGGANLIDARPKEFFEGETRHAAAKAPGTIQGAQSLDNAVWFAKGSAALLPADEVRRIAATSGVAAAQPNAESVNFCNTGHWAATNWFVMSEILGQSKAKLYPESMVEWSRANLPMSNVPSRMKQLMIDMKLSGK